MISLSAPNKMDLSCSSSSSSSSSSLAPSPTGHLSFSIDSLLSSNGHALSPPISVPSNSTIRSLQSLFNDGLINFNPTINLMRSDAVDYSVPFHHKNMTPFSSNLLTPVRNISLENLMSRIIIQDHISKNYPFSYPPKYSQGESNYFVS